MPELFCRSGLLQSNDNKEARPFCVRGAPGIIAASGAATVGKFVLLSILLSVIDLGGIFNERDLQQRTNGRGNNLGAQR